MPGEPRRVLVTGAGSGIGRALAIEAARLGFAVGLCGRRLAAIEETAAMLDRTAPALIIPADITDPAGRARIVARVGADWGGLDVLVNNAGVIKAASVGQTDDATLHSIFHTNVIGPIALIRDLMPLLAASRPARVVNIGSIFGDIPYPDFAAYSASKFALRGFSMALRRECADLGIAVTYAAPRATQTDGARAFERLMATSKMRLDSPELVARRIWKAVNRDADAVYAGGPERLYVLMQRMFPRFVDWALARQAGRSHPELPRLHPVREEIADATRHS